MRTQIVPSKACEDLSRLSLVHNLKQKVKDLKLEVKNQESIIN